MTKNLKGKTVTRENAYEVYRRPGWAWYVLKHYQSPEAEKANPYARVFCLVTSPIVGESGELGDVYLREILESATLDAPAVAPTATANAVASRLREFRLAQDGDRDHYE